MANGGRPFQTGSSIETIVNFFNSRDFRSFIFFFSITI